MSLIRHFDPTLGLQSVKSDNLAKTSGVIYELQDNGRGSKLVGKVL